MTRTTTKKLKLHVDDLRIDSFATTRADEPGGTVLGEQCTCQTRCTCPGNSCDGTCADTCPNTCMTCPETCFTCPLSCYPSCLGTCDYFNPSCVYTDCFSRQASPEHCM